jgi:hypothetical protein
MVRRTGASLTHHAKRAAAAAAIYGYLGIR